MSRLRPADAFLLALLLVLFSIALFLHVGRVTQGALAWVPVHVHPAPGAAEYPSVAGFWSDDAAMAPGLAKGDALLAVGDASLEGVGTLGFYARVYAEADGALEVPLRGVGRETRLQLVAIPYPWRKTAIGVSFALIGGLAFWRTRGSRAARFFAVAATGHALHWMDFWGGSHAQTYAAVASFGIGASVAAPMTLRAILSFPEEVARNSSFSALWPWTFALCGVGVTSWAFGVPLSPAWGQPLALGGTFALVVTSIALLTRNYRRASPAGRRQLKWVVLGFYVGLAPAALAAGVTLARPELWWLYEASLAGMLVVPVFIFVALVRFNLFDIDRLITTAATLSILLFVFVGALVLLLAPITAALQGVVDARVGQAFVAAALAAFVLPGRRLLDRLLGGYFFPESDALERDAHVLRRDLAVSEKPEELLALLGSRLSSLLRSDCVVIYGRTGEHFAPVFARGRAVAPAFDGDGPLIQALEAETTALDVTLAGRTRRAPPASELERGALDAMGVEIAIPMVLDEELAAFVCVGEKRSGDVFTATDRALLQGIVDKAADHLASFNRAEDYREMNEQLVKFVPGAIADRLARGGELGEGKCHVSVLFVDIRGYTSIAEAAAPEAIFGLINRYTELVSGIVREAGGSVVEFNGDGMMAVFGAPNPLPHKERVAVLAARRIVDAVRGLEVRDARGVVSEAQVGVGVASGEGFSGSFRAVDRLIWSVVGNTTNLAARLQSLTRDYGASIAIDGATFAAAPDAAPDFVVRLAQQVRGRTDQIDIYTLPL